MSLSISTTLKNIEETKEWISEAISKHHSGEKEEFVIIEAGEFVGMISPRYLSSSEVDIGMWIAPKMQGRGYGKQSLELLIDMLKSKGISRLIYSTDKHNSPSINLATSLDFKRISEGNELVFERHL